MAYEQAQIQVQKTEEFEQLRSAIERIFGSPLLSKFLGKLQDRDLRIRDFEKIAGLGLFEELDPALAAGAKSANQLYGALAVSDQALMREIYLEKLERVDAKLRQKYQKVYRYY